MTDDLRDTMLHGSLAGLRPDETPGIVLPSAGLDWSVTGSTLLLTPTLP